MLNYFPTRLEKVILCCELNTIRSVLIYTLLLLLKSVNNPLQCNNGRTETLTHWLASDRTLFTV